MSAEELLADIATCFASSQYPGDSALLPPGSAADAEVLRVQAAFKGLAWQDVPATVLHEQRTRLSLLSQAGFAYFLPAFMSLLVRSVPLASDDAAELVKLLKLPTELNGTAVAQLIGQYEAAGQPSESEFSSLVQAQLTQTNQAIHHFIDRASRFSFAQGRAIYHFLAYLHEQRGPTALSEEPALAMQRYWFRFA